MGFWKAWEEPITPSMIPARQLLCYFFIIRNPQDPALIKAPIVTDYIVYPRGCNIILGGLLRDFTRFRARLKLSVLIMM